MGDIFVFNNWTCLLFLSIAKQKKTPNKKNMHKAGSSYSSSHSHTRKSTIETTFQYSDHSESLPDVVPHEEGTQTRKVIYGNSFEC